VIDYSVALIRASDGAWVLPYWINQGNAEEMARHERAMDYLFWKSGILDIVQSRYPIILKGITDDTDPV